MKKVYIPPSKISGKATRRTRAVPSQSLKTEELIRRFMRGLPVDAKVHQPVYYGNDPSLSSTDLERLSHLDPVDKAQMVMDQRASAERIKADFNAALKDVMDEKAAEKEAEEKARRASAGREYLDNTLPDDTEASEVSNKSRRRNTNKE